MNDIQQLLNTFESLEKEMGQFSILAGDVLRSIEAHEFVSEKVNTDMMQCIMELNKKQKEVFKLYEKSGLGETAPKKMQEMRDQIEKGLEDRSQLEYLEAVRKSFQSLYTEDPEVDAALQKFKDKVDTIKVEKYPLDKCLVYIRPFAVFLTVIKSNDPEKTVELVPILMDYFGSKLVAHVTMSKDIYIGEGATEFTMEEQIPEDSANQAELPEEKGKAVTGAPKKKAAKQSPEKPAEQVAAAGAQEQKTEAADAKEPVAEEPVLMEKTAEAAVSTVEEPETGAADGAVAEADKPASKAADEVIVKEEAETPAEAPIDAPAGEKTAAEAEELADPVLLEPVVAAEAETDITAEAVSVAEKEPVEELAEPIIELAKAEEPEATAAAGAVEEDKATADIAKEPEKAEPIEDTAPIEGDDGLVFDLLASDAEKKEELDEKYEEYLKEQKKTAKIEKELMKADVGPTELDPDALGTIELEPMEPEIKEDMPEANVISLEGLEEVTRPARPTKPKKVDLKALLEEDTFSESKLDDPELADMNTGRKKRKRGKRDSGFLNPKGIMGGF